MSLVTLAFPSARIGNQGRRSFMAGYVDHSGDFVVFGKAAVGGWDERESGG